MTTKTTKYVQINVQGKISKAECLKVTNKTLLGKYPKICLDINNSNAAKLDDNSRKLFSYGNMKLKQLRQRLSENGFVGKIASFDLPAGFTCPAANLCHSRVYSSIDKNGKTKRNTVDLGQFRCYAVKAESQYSNVYNFHWNNLNISLSDNFVDAITSEIITNNIKIVRIHSAGDYYSLDYLRKWIQIARLNPDVQFFGYTKIAPFVSYLISEKLDNFHLVYSMGGKMDKIAQERNLPNCTVIVDKDSFNGLVACEEVKSDDYELICQQKSFGINLH